MWFEFCMTYLKNTSQLPDHTGILAIALKFDFFLYHSVFAVEISSNIYHHISLRVSPFLAIHLSGSNVISLSDLSI